MEDFLDKYTVREFLEWLEKEPLDEYIEPKAVSIDPGDDTVIISMADVELLAKRFMEKMHRYEVVVRGCIFYIHDNKTCQDIIKWRFNDANKKQMQKIANNVCKNLNNGTISFIGNEKPCW